MDYDRFISLVQSRARVKTAAAASAIRATFETLAERLGAKEAHRLAAQLPKKIADYLDGSPPETGEPFSFDEFCRRIALRETCALEDAVFHARCAIAILKKAVTTGEISHVIEMLSPDFTPVFVTVEAGTPSRRA